LDTQELDPLRNLENNTPNESNINTDLNINLDSLDTLNINDSKETSLNLNEDLNVVIEDNIINKNNIVDDNKEDILNNPEILLAQSMESVLSDEEKEKQRLYEEDKQWKTKLKNFITNSKTVQLDLFKEEVFSVRKKIFLDTLKKEHKYLVYSG
jgi:hypothetical protein